MSCGVHAGGLLDPVLRETGTPPVVALSGGPAVAAFMPERHRTAVCAA